jgi:hypothetical protein
MGAIGREWPGNSATDRQGATSSPGCPLFLIKLWFRCDQLDEFTAPSDVATSSNRALVEPSFTVAMDAFSGDL